MLAFSFKVGWGFNIASITKTASRKILILDLFYKISFFGGSL